MAWWLIIPSFYELECYVSTSFIINFNKIYDVTIFTTYFNFICKIAYLPPIWTCKIFNLYLLIGRNFTYFGFFNVYPKFIYRYWLSRGALGQGGPRHLLTWLTGSLRPWLFIILSNSFSAHKSLWNILMNWK